MAKGLLGVASAIALVTLLSKAVGFGRELAIAAVFGADVGKDAYTIAYIIPSFSLVMLGGLTGPFHTATQKVIATLRQQGRDGEVAGVVAAIAVLVTLVMGALSVVAYLGAPWLVRAVAARASDPVFVLAVEQLRVMAPLIVLGGWIGILCGISNDQGDYARPSLSPLVASLAVIAAVLWRADPMLLAWGTLVGGVGQVLLQAPAAWRLWRTRPADAGRVDLRHPEVKGIWGVLLPACVSSTIGTISVIIGTNFASSLPAGSISAFDFANKLIQLPLGILMTALLIPLFPLLTQAAVASDRPELFRRMNQGLATIGLATFPLIALFVAASEPVVAVVFQRGAFDAADTRLTAVVLAICALGIWTYAARDLMIRVFYALDDGRTPLLVSLASLGVTVAAMAAVIGPFGLNGLAAATAGVTVFNCALIAVLLRRKLGELPLGGSAPVVGKAAVAAGVAGLAAHLAGPWLPGTGTFVEALARLVAQGAVLGAVYAGALAAFGVPVGPAAASLLARFRRRRPA